MAAGTLFKGLAVVHTYPDPNDETWIRVISLREADARERRRHENQDD